MEPSVPLRTRYRPTDVIIGTEVRVTGEERIPATYFHADCAGARVCVFPAGYVWVLLGVFCDRQH